MTTSEFQFEMVYTNADQIKNEESEVAAETT